MFHKILVAIDSSENGHKVFDTALALAKATGSSLLLLHVLSYEEEGSPEVATIGLEYYPAIAGEIAELQQKQWAAYEQRGLEMLQAYCDRASAEGVKAELMQNTGSPGRTICERSTSWDADLIVVGRRGHSGLNELLMGSVSNYVLHHAPCPVLAVQGKIQPKTAPTADSTVAALS